MASRREYQPNLSPQANTPETTEANGEKPIAIDGFQQVVDMLMAADPAFRESLLARLARRDPRLVKSLREQIL